MSVATHCHGCGVELPPAPAATRNRKWCSDRCRKRQYAGTCVDCGAMTNGSCGRGPHAPQRCRKCDQKQIGPRRREHFRAQRELVERLWAEGKKTREIADIMGWTGSFRNSGIGILRGRGYDLPHRRTPEQVARISNGGRTNLVKARAVLAEQRKIAA